MTAAAKKTETFRMSYWPRRNEYAGACVLCGEKVGVRKGWIQKERETEKWVTVCHSCAHAHSRSLPDEHSAQSMANGSKAKIDLHICSRCGARVGLCKNKAGKWYLAGVREGSYGEYRTKVMPWVVHSPENGTCVSFEERAAEYDAHEKKKAINYAAALDVVEALKKGEIDEGEAGRRISDAMYGEVK